MRTGFSLVELLVVVMVILVIAAIAIPSFFQARMKTNEASAVVSMRTIHTAQMMYYETYPEVGFASTLPILGTNGTACDIPGPKNACIIMDDPLASGMKNGYVFDLVSDGLRPSMSYSVTATPETSGITGRCSFSSNQGGDISVQDSTSGGRFSVGSAGGGCDH